MNPRKAVPVLVIASVALLACATLAQAGSKHPTPAPVNPPLVQRPAYTFENCDLPTVLKMLANEARVELDLDPAIRGTINMRLEDGDAKQAIEILSMSENLRLEVANGKYHIKATDKTDDAHKGGEKPADGFEAFGQALAKTLSDVADTVTKPETAAKFARYKRSYYLALIKEGFSADEALRIVVAVGDPGLLNNQKGK